MRGMWMAMTLVMLLCLVARVSEACTLAWDPVVTNTDGSPVTDLAGYRVYYTAPGSTVTQLLGEVGPTSVTLSIVCPKGDFWVRAVNVPGLESESSNILKIRQPGKVNAFTVSR